MDRSWWRHGSEYSLDVRLIPQQLETPANSAGVLLVYEPLTSLKGSCMCGNHSRLICLCLASKNCIEWQLICA